MKMATKTLIFVLSLYCCIIVINSVKNKSKKGVLSTKTQAESGCFCKVWS